VRLWALWHVTADPERSRVFLEWWNWGRLCTSMKSPHFWRRPEHIPGLDPASCLGGWEWWTVYERIKQCSLPYVDCTLKLGWGWGLSGHPLYPVERVSINALFEPSSNLVNWIEIRYYRNHELSFMFLAQRHFYITDRGAPWKCPSTISVSNSIWKSSRGLWWAASTERG
jgi:hypothetical protein